MLSNAINGLNSASAREKFGALLTSSNFDAVLFAVLCYFLWFYRNKALFERVNIDSVSIMTLENNSLVEFWEANRWLKHSHLLLLSRLWVSPPSFGFHVFFDGTMARSTPGAGCGVYVTNQNGVIVHGMSESFASIQDPHLVGSLQSAKLFSRCNSLVSSQFLLSAMLKISLHRS